jgi:hypothetical protein
VDLYCFDPDSKRAEVVGVRMQTRLAESLRYILDQCAGRVSFPDAGMAAFLDRLARGPVSPLVFGAYCDLVLALNSNALDQAQAIFSEISAAPNVARGPKIIDLADPSLDLATNRYRRFADTDVNMPISIGPPKPEDAALDRALISEALATLDAWNCSLADEIRILLREIVLATGPFAGVSSFMLWGATVLSVRSHKTVLDMIQALAHESGHNLLFGLCADGPMHENDDQSRYSSPLRSDPRPMDGIIHATYVTARMHQAVQRLADASVLNAAQMDEARATNANNAEGFANGIKEIENHARLTPLGQVILEGAERYMDAYLN